MEEKTHKIHKLFFSTFLLSACTFGGGYVIVPLMRKKFVDELHWLDEQEMMDLTAIAQAAPGPIAVNCSILVGYRISGVMGAMFAILGTILPPLLIISLVTLFYQAFRENHVIATMMLGMQAGIAAIIADVVLSMSKPIVMNKRKMPLILLLGSFIAVCLFHVHMIAVLFICGLLGGVDAWSHRKEQK